MDGAKEALSRNIRDAREEDVPGILAIYNHAVVHTMATADESPVALETRQEWFKERKQKGLPVLVYELEGKMAGWASLNPYSPKTGYRLTVDNSVYVHPEFQGRGIGRALLTELLSRARSAKFHTVVASIDAGNLASIRLHEQFGFVEVARYRELARKFERWMDVVHLQLMLE